MDPIEKARAEMGGLERFVAGLPGIEGYRNKEMRCDADKQVRDMLARRLEARRRKLTGMQGDLLTSGGLAWMDDVERAVGRFQLLIDKVKTAAYGYAPLFALNRVREDDLDRVVQFDQALMVEAARLDEALTALETAVKGNEGIKEALAAVSGLLASLNETFGRRVEVIQNSAE